MERIGEVTTISDLVACFQRLFDGGFAYRESKMYILSRDGEQLRPVGDVITHHNDTDCSIDILRGNEGDGTAEFWQIMGILKSVKRPGGRVRILADGLGEANLVDLQSVLMAPDLSEDLRLNMGEIDVILAG